MSSFSRSSAPCNESPAHPQSLLVCLQPPAQVSELFVEPRDLLASRQLSARGSSVAPDDLPLVPSSSSRLPQAVAQPAAIRGVSSSKRSTCLRAEARLSCRMEVSLVLLPRHRFKVPREAAREAPDVPESQALIESGDLEVQSLDLFFLFSHQVSKPCVLVSQHLLEISVQR